MGGALCGAAAAGLKSWTCCSSATCGTNIRMLLQLRKPSSPKFSTCQTPCWRIISSGMQPPQNPSSQSSSGGSPLIGCEVIASLRAQVLAVVLSSGFLLALLLSPEPGGLWRGLAAALALVLGWSPVRTIVFSRGSQAIRRIEWHQDGAWRLADGASRPHTVALSPASASLGPWLLL